jgi:hypothetical protein
MCKLDHRTAKHFEHRATQAATQEEGITLLNSPAISGQPKGIIMYNIIQTAKKKTMKRALAAKNKNKKGTPLAGPDAGV